jgi:hypothetical protein
MQPRLSSTLPSRAILTTNPYSTFTQTTSLLKDFQTYVKKFIYDFFHVFILNGSIKLKIMQYLVKSKCFKKK